MTGTYGRQWTGGYGDVPTPEWLMALEALTVDQVKHGLARIAEDPVAWKWPPNLMEFRVLCLPTSEDFNLPSEDDAFSQAVGSASDKHPSVVMTLRDMGDEVYKFRRAESEKARRIFKKHWDKTVEHVMAGGELPEVEKQVEDKPVKASAEVAESNLGGIRGMFD